MQRLREVVGDNNNNNENVSSPRENVSTSGNMVCLDEQTISREELERRREDKSTRIAELADGSYKTLNHIRG